MRFCGSNKDKLIKIGLNLLFYSMLLILLYWIIYPYTSFSYRKPFIQPFAMRLNVTEVELEEGESFRLYVVGIKKKAKFTTAHFKVLEVNSSGMIRARRKGRAIVKVFVGNRVLKCKVIVTKKKS